MSGALDVWSTGVNASAAFYVGAPQSCQFSCGNFFVLAQQSIAASRCLNDSEGVCVWCSVRQSEECLIL